MRRSRSAAGDRSAEESSLLATRDGCGDAGLCGVLGRWLPEEEEEAAPADDCEETARLAAEPGLAADEATAAAAGLLAPTGDDTAAGAAEESIHGLASSSRIRSADTYRGKG